MIAPADVKSYLPKPGNAVAVSSTSTSAQDVGESTTQIIVTCTVPFHIRAGLADVGAATTNDMRFAADEPVRFDVNSGVRYFRVIRSGGADGTLTWAVSK